MIVYHLFFFLIIYQVNLTTQKSTLVSPNSIELELNIRINSSDVL